MTENWKSVVGYEGIYECSDQGRVRSLTRRVRNSRGTTSKVNGCYLRGQTLRGGYLGVNLCRDGTQKTYVIHILMMALFVGPRPPGLVIRHIDGNCQNNKLENLVYGTYKENSADRYIHGTMLFGEKMPLAKLTEKDVEFIRASSEPQRKLARLFGVSQTAIGKAKRGENWAYL